MLSTVLRLTRAKGYAHFMALPLAALPWRGTSLEQNALWGLRGAVTAGLLLGYAYLLNNIRDRTLDTDTAKNPLAGAQGDTLLPFAKGLCVALLLLPLALAATASTAALIATGVVLAAATVYSTGPRLKAWPVVGTLMNAPIFVPLLWVGAIEGPLDPRLWSLGAVLTGLLLQNQLVHEAGDAEDDRAGGARTTFVTLGRVPTAMLVFVAGVATLPWNLGGTEAAPLAGFAALVFAGVFPWLVAMKGDDGALMRNARLAQRLASAVYGAALWAAMVLG